MEIFIGLLCDESTIKVLHGAESLDIPYIFNNLLNNNKYKIKKFIQNLYDTKFICDYYYLDKPRGKCGIYNILEEFRVIDKKEIKYLDDLGNKLGEIYLLDFNIFTMTKEMIEYAYYDVLYLPDLIKSIFNYFNKNNDLKLIQELTGINYYYKRNDGANLQNKINQFNNYFIKYRDDKIKLIDYFNWYYYSELSSKLIKLARIKYFNNFIETIIKLVIYLKLVNNKKIFISNEEINNDKLNEYNISDILLNNKELLKEFNKIYLKIMV